MFEIYASLLKLQTESLKTASDRENMLLYISNMFMKDWREGNYTLIVLTLQSFRTNCIPCPGYIVDEQK